MKKREGRQLAGICIARTTLVRGCMRGKVKKGALPVALCPSRTNHRC
jgi:hypothetical protein